MGAYENPQVFVPDYNVIGQNFQQGFNTMYQIMQQKKAKKEAQKKKRDEAEAAFYSGTSLPPVHGLTEKHNQGIGEFYRQSVGGFGGWNEMTKLQQAKVLEDVRLMEAGVQGLSGGILKYQTGNYSSAIDPTIMGLMDRIVYPKEDDPNGEWGYDIRLGDNGVEFFYTEGGEEKSVPIKTMSTWEQLFDDPTPYVDNIRNNVNAEVDEIKNDIMIGRYTAKEGLKNLQERDYYLDIIDFDPKDVGTINYYSKYVDKGGDYHPTKKMMEKELDAIKELKIKDADDNLIIDNDKFISDEELQAYHEYQDQQIRKHIDAEVFNKLTTYELGRNPRYTSPLYDTPEEADAFIASEKDRLEGINPGFTYTFESEEVTDTQTGDVKWEVKMQKYRTPPGNEPNVHVRDDGTFDPDGEPNVYMSRADINAQIKSNKEKYKTNLKDNIKLEFKKKLFSIQSFINNPNAKWESYNDLIVNHLPELIDESKSKKYSKSEIEKKNLTGLDQYEKIVTLVDTNEDDVKDDKDVHAYIYRKYKGLGKNEKLLTDKLFKEYKFITLFHKLKIPHIDGRTGKPVIISDISPVTREDGSMVLRFDTYYGNKPYPVDIELTEENLGYIVRDFMGTLSNDVKDLQSDLKLSKDNRDLNATREGFYKHMTPFERIEKLADLYLEEFISGSEELGEEKNNLRNNLVADLTKEEKKRVNELLEKKKKELKNK